MSRMARPIWFFTLTAGLCGGPLAGCSHTVPWGKPSADKGTPAPPPAFLRAASGENPKAPILADSPYAPLPPPEPKETQAKRAVAEFPDVRPPGERRGAPAIGLGEPADLKAEPKVPSNPEPVVASKPEDDPAVVAALHFFLEKRPEEALLRLKNIDKANQDMLLGLLPLVARLGEGSLSQATPQELAALVDGLDGLLAPLRGRAPLAIEKACLCRWIGTYGVYEPMPPEHRFRHGERVLIYVQLKNFASAEEKLPSGQVRHVIRLAGTAEILDEAGHKVLPRPIIFQRQGPQADESRSPRHDYFDTYSFNVPEAIPPGLYTLCVRVEDRGTNPPRAVQGSLDFRVTNLTAQGP